jgi:hypothetical protein
MDSVTEHRVIVDTHRHPVGAKLAAKMAVSLSTEWDALSAFSDRGI